MAYIYVIGSLYGSIIFIIIKIIIIIIIIMIISSVSRTSVEIPRDARSREH
jgi:uncharacterized membrane protein